MERWLRGKINRVWWGTGLKSLTFVFFVFIDVVLGIYVVGCACIVCAVGILFIWLTILLVKCTIKVFSSLKTKKNKKKSEVIFD